MSTPELNARSIKELYPQIFDWLNLQDLNGVIIVVLMLVVSGINTGWNIGDDVTYSGTVSGALDKWLRYKLDSHLVYMGSGDGRAGWLNGLRRKVSGRLRSARRKGSRAGPPQAAVDERQMLDLEQGRIVSDTQAKAMPTADTRRPSAPGNRPTVGQRHEDLATARAMQIRGSASMGVARSQHGFTVFPVEGSGAGGERRADMGEYSNVQFEVIVPPAIAQTLLDRLYTDYMPRYGLVVFESDIRVLRPQKF